MENAASTVVLVAHPHSPLEARAHHRDVALAASRCFGEIWVRSCGGYAAEVHVLSRSAFAQKLSILVPEHIADILARVRAKYLLTSHYTTFDEPVSRLLQCLGWQTSVSMQLTPRFEPVDVAPVVS